MANAFTNFLGGIVKGVFGTSALMKDYQHADRLYVRDTYARAPKFGFLYFVNFNINTDAINKRTKWGTTFYSEVGLLVKRIDQPKFQIDTEVINQYNRKAIIQKQIKYQPINIEFHDDNSEITRDLWKNYYYYYYKDGIYGDRQSANQLVPAFDDTKFAKRFYKYGLDNQQLKPFFKSIDIYVLHQQAFTQYTLANPIITEWSHDTLDQSESNKVLSNKMTIGYESVYYNQGKIKKGTDVDKFRAFYDVTPSPLSIGGNGSKTIFGPGGVIAGAQGVLGSLSSGNFLAAAIQANNLRRNARGINKATLQAEATNITGNFLQGIASTNPANPRSNNILVAGVSGVQQFNTLATPVSLTKK